MLSCSYFIFLVLPSNTRFVKKNCWGHKSDYYKLKWTTRGKCGSHIEAGFFFSPNFSTQMNVSNSTMQTRYTLKVTMWNISVKVSTKVTVCVSMK